ncbi:MAG TPA: radical SAM protein, partial [Thiotrichales bacterium]|nr:radical SAM protein [Thiotrichales bacterium]
AQDTSAYGVDIQYRTGFWQGRPVKSHIQQLAEALGEFGIWIRLHYIYPYPHVDKLIPLMAEGKILPYLDIPMQHASSRILKAMRRPAHAEKMLERIQSWREICPELTIRSTFIVGFPGETEAEFSELLDFIREARLDRVGCFEYSPVEGARANKIADHIPVEIQHARFEQFMSVQAEISQEILNKKIGQQETVLVDAVENGNSIARSQSDAPEIDGQVVIANKELPVGEFVEVEIIDADHYDLYAAIPSKGAHIKK